MNEKSKKIFISLLVMKFKPVIFIVNYLYNLFKNNRYSNELSK